MINTDYLTWKSIAVAAGIVLGVIGFVVLLWFAFTKHQEWVSWCENEMNGRIVKDTDTSVGTGIDANGNPTTVTTTDTTYYCLNEDGGIIDIR